MQGPVHEQVRPVIGHRLILGAGFAVDNRRTQHEIAQRHRLIVRQNCVLAGGKRQHIGRRIALAIASVQFAPFFFSDEPNSNLAALLGYVPCACERGLQPLPYGGIVRKVFTFANGL